MMPHGALNAVSKSTYQKRLPFIDMRGEEPILELVGVFPKCVHKLLPTIQASWALE